MVNFNSTKPVVKSWTFLGVALCLVEPVQQVLDLLPEAINDMLPVLPPHAAAVASIIGASIVAARRLLKPIQKPIKNLVIQKKDY